jgi:hypothetical protein
MSIHTAIDHAASAFLPVEVLRSRSGGVVKSRFTGMGGEVR